MFLKFINPTPKPTESPDEDRNFEIPPNWARPMENILFHGEIGLNIFVALLNITVCTVFWRATKPEFKAAFYIIMRTFTMFVALNAIGTLIETGERQRKDYMTTWWLQGILIINMFTCIASSLWLFLAGFNRMMVLVWPKKVVKAWEKWVVRSTLIIVAILALGLSFLYQTLCGVYTKYDKATNTVNVLTTSSMAEPLTIAIYAFPLISLVFYVIAYYNLRQKRLQVISDRTKTMIDKAERRTLNIGMIIMITYTIALAAHIYLIYFCTREIFIPIYNRIDEIVSTAPQIALPMTLVLCNTEMFLGRRKSKTVGAVAVGAVAVGAVHKLSVKIMFIADENKVNPDVHESKTSSKTRVLASDARIE